MADEDVGAAVAAIIAILDALGIPNPLRKSSEFDSMPEAELKKRNRWIELSACAGAVLTFFSLLASILYFGLEPTLWWGALIFGLPFTVFLAIIATFTLLHGRNRWDEFWRFHERTANIHLYVLLAIYIPVALVGLLSAAFLLA